MYFICSTSFATRLYIIEYPMDPSQCGLHFLGGGDNTFSKVKQFI